MVISDVFGETNRCKVVAYGSGKIESPLAQPLVDIDVIMILVAQMNPPDMLKDAFIQILVSGITSLDNTVTLHAKVTAALRQVIFPRTGPHTR